jgi:hypothetical protein
MSRARWKAAAPKIAAVGCYRMAMSGSGLRLRGRRRLRAGLGPGANDNWRRSGGALRERLWIAGADRATVLSRSNSRNSRFGRNNSRLGRQKFPVIGIENLST